MINQSDNIKVFSEEEANLQLQLIYDQWKKKKFLESEEDYVFRMEYINRPMVGIIIYR